MILASSAETHTFVSLQADATYYSVLIASPTWDKKLLLNQPSSLIRLCSFCFSPVEDSGVPPLKHSCGLKASLVQSSESKEQDKSFSRGTIASPMAPTIQGKERQLSIQASSPTWMCKLQNHQQQDPVYLCKMWVPLFWKDSQNKKKCLPLSVTEPSSVFIQMVNTFLKPTKYYEGHQI